MSTAARGLGLTIPLPGVSLADHGALVDTAAESGFTGVWTGEASGLDGFSPLVFAAARRPELDLGTAIISSFTRGPALVAMSAAALSEATSAEVFLGIGSSSNVIVERWNDVSFDRPFSRTRDLLRFLRRVLSGERTVFRGDTFDVDGFRLERPPERPPRLLVAALRERMLALAGAEADGVILNWLSAKDAKEVAGRVLDQNSDAEVVARLFVITGDDDAVAREQARRQIAAYLTVPVYAEYQRWLGRGDALEPMWQAWAAGDRRAATAAVPDGVIDDLFLLGSADAVAEGIAQYVAAGVTRPVVALTTTSGEVGRHIADIGAAVRARLGASAVLGDAGSGRLS